MDSFNHWSSPLPQHPVVCNKNLTSLLSHCDPNNQCRACFLTMHHYPSAIAATICCSWRGDGVQVLEQHLLGAAVTWQLHHALEYELCLPRQCMTCQASSSSDSAIARKDTRGGEAGLVPASSISQLLLLLLVHSHNWERVGCASASALPWSSPYQHVVFPLPLQGRGHLAEGHCEQLFVSSLISL